MLDEYRQKFTDFHTQTQRERHQFATGRKDEDETYVWLAEYSDLFTADAVAMLRAAHEAISVDRPNARTAAARLRAFGEEGRLHAQTRELDREIASVERDAVFRWGEHSLNLAQAQAQITQQANARQRREMSLRAGDLVRQGNDLRAERQVKWHDYAIGSGYTGVIDLLSQRRGVSYDQFNAQLTLLLMLTEGSYRSAAAAWLPHTAGVRLEEADFNDVAYARQQLGAAAYFPSARAKEVAQALCEGWGWQIEKQSNLTFDRLAQRSAIRSAEGFLLRVPSDVRLALPAQAISDAAFYTQYFKTLAAAQQAAWTSSQQPYECRVAGDPGVTLAWEYLFASLMQDSALLVSQFGFSRSDGLRQALARGNMYAIRRDAMLWLYEQELYAGKFTGPRADEAASHFVTLSAETLHLRADEAEHWRAVSRPLRSADRLRARAFAAQFSEYLKTNFGSRWWAARAAGDMLIDLWNTGHRYTVEELAALIGLGPLSYDWLAASANAALSEF